MQYYALGEFTTLVGESLLAWLSSSMALKSIGLLQLPRIARSKPIWVSPETDARPRLSDYAADRQTLHAALSKWYLCGSEGNFDKNESLAVTFAEKAAARQLPAAEFALGYFYEVGIGGPIDLEKAKRWYERVSLPFGPL